MATTGHNFPPRSFPGQRPRPFPGDSRRENPKRLLRLRVLEEWRGIADSREKPDRAVPISKLVEALLPKLGLGERLEARQMAEAWKEIVGEFLAAHSSPEGLRDGCLQVRVSQPSVRYELEQVWKPKIISDLQKRLGKNKVRSIRFHL